MKAIRYTNTARNGDFSEKIVSEKDLRDGLLTSNEDARKYDSEILLDDDIIRDASLEFLVDAIRKDSAAYEAKYTDMGKSTIDIIEA